MKIEGGEDGGDATNGRSAARFVIAFLFQRNRGKVNDICIRAAAYVIYITYDICIADIRIAAARAAHPGCPQRDRKRVGCSILTPRPSVSGARGRARARVSNREPAIARESCARARAYFSIYSELIATLVPDLPAKRIRQGFLPR